MRGSARYSHDWPFRGELARSRDCPRSVHDELEDEDSESEEEASSDEEDAEEDE